jgi:ribonuclease Z
MKNLRSGTQSWQGKNLLVHVLHSRAGVAQQIWIENEKGAVLIDAGDGSLRDLISHDLDPGRIRGVVFTHGHFDHVGGLYSLLGFLRMIGRKKPLPIIAPRGCEEVFSLVESFESCYPDTIPFQIRRRGVRSGQITRIAGMSIKAHEVVHCGSIKGAEILDRIPAMGYRISHKGESIAISGDTGFCPSLERLAKGADLAIVEASYKKSKGLDKDVLKKVHLSEELARKVGRLAKNFFLVHRGGGE